MSAVVYAEKGCFPFVLSLRALNHGSRGCCSKVGKKWKHILQHMGHVFLKCDFTVLNEANIWKHVFHYEGHVFSNACSAILHISLTSTFIYCRYEPIIENWSYYSCHRIKNHFTYRPYFVRGHAVAGRSRVRFPMRSLYVSVDLILPAAPWPWVSTQPLTEMSTRNLPGG
jgi:hypothetical protein